MGSIEQALKTYLQFRKRISSITNKKYGADKDLSGFTCKVGDIGEAEAVFTKMPNGEAKMQLTIDGFSFVHQFKMEYRGLEDAFNICITNVMKMMGESNKKYSFKEIEVMVLTGKACKWHNVQQGSISLKSKGSYWEWMPLYSKKQKSAVDMGTVSIAVTAKDWDEFEATEKDSWERRGYTFKSMPPMRESRILTLSEYLNESTPKAIGVSREEFEDVTDIVVQIVDKFDIYDEGIADKVEKTTVHSIKRLYYDKDDAEMAFALKTKEGKSYKVVINTWDTDDIVKSIEVLKEATNESDSFDWIYPSEKVRMQSREFSDNRKVLIDRMTADITPYELSEMLYRAEAVALRTLEGDPHHISTMLAYKMNGLNVVYSVTDYKDSTWVSVDALVGDAIQKIKRMEPVQKASFYSVKGKPFDMAGVIRTNIGYVILPMWRNGDMPFTILL